MDEKSKFVSDDPRVVKKLIEKTAKPQNLIETQTDGRKVYGKAFNKLTGTRGETAVKVVTEPLSNSREKVITSHPVNASSLSTVLSVVGAASMISGMIGDQLDFRAAHGRDATLLETLYGAATGEMRSAEEINAQAFQYATRPQ